MICGLPIRVRVQLAAVKRQDVGGKQVRVEPRQQRRQPALVRRRNHQHARALLRAETCDRRGSRDRA